MICNIRIAKYSEVTKKTKLVEHISQSFLRPFIYAFDVMDEEVELQGYAHSIYVDIKELR